MKSKTRISSRIIKCNVNTQHSDLAHLSIFMTVKKKKKEITDKDGKFSESIHLSIADFFQLNGLEKFLH